jgi:chromosome segregation ATPase
LTINKSIGELTTLDGSLDKTLKASEQLKDLPQILQKYMLLGNYQIGNAKKFDSHSIFNDIGSIDGFIAQFVNLDEAQQKAFLSLSSFDEGLEDYIENTKNAVQIGEKFNSQLFEQIASQKDGITTGVLNEFMKAGGLKDAKGVLALPNTQDAIALMEDYANHCSDASKTQQLFNAGILEQENGVYKLSQAFLKEISVKQASTVATVALTAAQKAWNVVAQYGKQLLLSLGVAAVAFIATKIVDYLMNLKTHSEELVATMNDSHDAAEQATKDVEEIQSKIDELNKSLKDAGVKKIEDIVDPAERERLQAINDMLQAQLELKKQLEKDANDKANADTSAVVNDKTEDSIVKSRTVNVSYAEGGANAGTHQVAEKVSKTESLHEYAAALEDTTQKRRDLQVELDQIEASSGKDSEEYANKKKELDALNETFESQKTKVEELSTAVSEQMGNYKTDADSFAQYKDEYVAGTNAMTAATKALANAQDNTGIDTTNLDIFSEKIKQIKNDIDNGDSQQSDWKTFNGLDAFSGMSGEAIINIDKDSSHQTETETAALEKLHKTADENKISFESLIGVFESFGLVQISNSAAADDYADKLEKTIGVIDNIQSAYKACSSAVEEYNQYGYMSVDSLQALLQMDDQYLNTLELVNGKLQVNQSAYADLLATQYAEAQMEAISQAISELNAIAKGDAAEKAETFTEATEDEKNKLTALCPALKDATVGTGELAAALAAAQGAANGEDADAVQAKIDGVMNALNTRLTLIGNNMSAAMNGAAGLRNQLDGFSNSSKKAADSSNKAADSSKTLLDAWSTLTSAMEEYNKWGSISLNTMKSLMGLDSKYTSCLKKQGNELVVDATACRDLIQAELKHAAATNDGTGKIGQYNQVLEYLDTHAKNGTISLNQLKDAIEGVNTALDEATGKTDEFQSGMEILHDLSKIDNANGEQIADYDTLKKVTELVTKHPELDGIFLDENGNLNVDDDKIKKAAEILVGKIINAANDSGQTGLAKLWSNRLEQLNKGDISMTDFWNGFGTDIEDANTKIDKFQSTFSAFRSALEEIQETGSLKSQDTLQELGQIDQSFLDQFIQDDGTYKINATGLRDMYVKQLEPLMKEFDGTVYGDYLKKMYDAVRAPTEEEYDVLVKATLEYKVAKEKYDRAVGRIDSSDASDEDKEAAKKAALDELTAVYNQKYQDVQETDAQVMAKLIAHWEDAKNAVESFKSALSDAKDILSSFLSLLSSANDKSNNDLKIWGDAMGKVIDKRIEALNKQKEALEENNEATERAIELSKAQDALARAQQQRTTRVYTENGYEWQANAEDVRTAREDLADKQREWNNKDAEKAIDDQIKKYNEFKDKLSEVMDDIGKSWKDYQKELEYTAQIQKMSLSQMEGSLDGYHDKIIASLNTGSAITSIQNLITNLESLINTLTKLNNLYSMLKTGEYKDLSIKGLWDTIKGFFNKGKSENVNKSFKDTFDAAKKAFNAGKKQLTDTATTGTNDVINAMINQIKTSGNSLIETFGGIWNTIKTGAQSLFNGSGEGGGIVSTVVNGFKAVGNAVSKSKIGSTLIKGVGKLVTGAGGLIKGAVSAIGTAGASAIPVVGGLAAAAGLGIYSGVKGIKHQKEIWSNKEDGFGKKAIKSVASFFWDISPIGGIVNLCKDIFGKSKETAENTKDTANSSSETAENTQKSATNLTINATQIVSKEENKATDETDKKNDATANEDKTVKTAATTLTGAGLGAAAGMAVGGPVGALIGTLLGGFAGFFLGGHANGLKSSKTNHFANVDERGSELIVRKPASGRYTYLETGDGVVPADITSRLFEMGGNPDKWFSDQLAKHSSASMVQSRDAGGISLSIGDVNVNNPVGDSDALARELVNRLPNKVVQELNRR